MKLLTHLLIETILKFYKREQIGQNFVIIEKKGFLMSQLKKVIETLHLDGTENGKIEIGILNEPYGEGSDSVASIGIFLNSDAADPNWKVHLPKANIDAVIAALQKAKEEM